MFYKFLICLFFFVFVSHGSATDDIIEQSIKELNASFEKIKERLNVNNSRTNIITEPTDRETEIADWRTAESTPLGGELYPDTKEKLDKYCNERDLRQEVIYNWILRKYPINRLVLLHSYILNKLWKRRNDKLCNSEELRAKHLRTAAGVKQFTEKLFKVKEELIEQLIDIKSGNTTSGLRPNVQLCCSYYKYRNESIAAVENAESREYVKEIFDEYQSDNTRNQCRNVSSTSAECMRLSRPPRAEIKYKSVGYYYGRALSTIVGEDN